MLIRSALILAMGLFLSSCIQEKLGKMEEKLDRIEKNGKAIMIKLVAMDREIQELKKAPGKGPARPGTNPNKVYTVKVGDSSAFGKENAPVTIVKWFDFQCPYCAQSVKLVDEIMKKYPDDVRVVFKNFPLNFHKQAKKAAKYALAAEKQGKFLEMYHAIFKEYRKLKADENYPLELAKNLGLDVEQLKKDLEDPALEKRITQEMGELRSSGIARLSVPKFLINGKEPKARDLGVWTKMIDEEIAKSKGGKKQEKKG